MIADLVRSVSDAEEFEKHRSAAKKIAEVRRVSTAAPMSTFWKQVSDLLTFRLLPQGLSWLTRLAVATGPVCLECGAVGESGCQHGRETWFDPGKPPERDPDTIRSVVIALAVAGLSVRDESGNSPSAKEIVETLTGGIGEDAPVEEMLGDEGFARLAGIAHDLHRVLREWRDVGDRVGSDMCRTLEDSPVRHVLADVRSDAVGLCETLVRECVHLGIRVGLTAIHRLRRLGHGGIGEALDAVEAVRVESRTRAKWGC